MHVIFEMHCVLYADKRIQLKFCRLLLSCTLAAVLRISEIEHYTSLLLTIRRGPFV